MCFRIVRFGLKADFFKKCQFYPRTFSWKILLRKKPWSCHKVLLNCVELSQQDLMDLMCIKFLQENWYLAFLTRILGVLMEIFQDYLRFYFIFLDFSGIKLPSISHKNLGGFNEDFSRLFKILFLNVFRIFKIALKNNLPFTYHAIKSKCQY